MARIAMSIDEMTDIITKLTNSSNEIEEIWNSIKTTEVEQIKESWVGKDCDAYINKLLDFDSEVKKVLQAQRLLASTFTNAKNQVISAQETIAGQASGL
ncbi:MAG: hypothetical protein IJO63_02570 [Bacilli bacterium]|nr:hypothetical protein [Bacilli bacterium]